MLRDALDKVKEIMPKMTPVVAEGIAYHQMDSVENSVNSLMKIAFRHVEGNDSDRLPEGFRYIDFDYVTPEEEYAVRAGISQTQAKSRKSTILDMSKTDSYLIKCNFENDGRRIEKYVAIPFARRGGITNVKGTEYGISPVLKTRGLSLVSKGYFAEFPRSKVTFEHLTEQFLVNGNIEHIYMPFTNSLHKKAKATRTNVPAVACWLFAKFGLKETFRKYINTEVEVYEIDNPILGELDTNEYAVCKPDPNARGARAQLAIVLPMKALTAQAKILIGSAFYVARQNPTRVIAEFVDTEGVDSQDLWQVMLGFSIFGKGNSEQRLAEEIRAHFSNIERMLDIIFRQELLTEGVECEDIYDFLYYVITRITERTSGEMQSMANLWGRYYTTTDYVIRDLREAIFTAHFNLVKAARKTGGRPVPHNVVTIILNKFIKRDIVHTINNGHGEVSPFMTATDNMLIGLTSHCIDQTEAVKAKGGRKKNGDFADPSKHLHASIAEVGSLANLPKASPYGFARINPYVSLDHLGRILRKPSLRPITAMMEADIRQKGV